MFSKQCLRGAWLALATAALDRVAKVFASRISTSVHLPGVDITQPIVNTGAAFSLFAGSGIWLALITFALICAVVVWLVTHPGARRLTRCGLWLIAGGGAANLWDRVVNGSVLDFLSFTFVRFPVFNVADVCVCVGAGLIILSVILQEAHDGAQHG